MASNRFQVCFRYCNMVWHDLSAELSTESGDNHNRISPLAQNPRAPGKALHIMSYFFGDRVDIGVRKAPATEWRGSPPPARTRLPWGAQRLRSHSQNRGSFRAGHMVEPCRELVCRFVAFRTVDHGFYTVAGTADAAGRDGAPVPQQFAAVPFLQILQSAIRCRPGTLRGRASKFPNNHRPRALGPQRAKRSRRR